MDQQDEEVERIRLLCEQLEGGLLNRLHRSAVYLTRNVDDAQDAVQEALASALVSLMHRSLEQIQAMSLEPWLFKILINTCKSNLIKDSIISRGRLEDLEDEQALEIEDGDRHARPEEVLELAEKRQVLEIGLSRLPAERRQAIILCYFGGCQYAEIAEILNIRLGTVKSHISRGIRSLGKMPEIQEVRNIGE